MTLKELFMIIPDYTKLLIMTDIDAGTGENFSIEIVRGDRRSGWRKEYYNWLFALNLEVDRIGAVSEDTCGNKEMLSIHCKPLKIARKRGIWIARERCEGDSEPNLICPFCGSEYEWFDAGDKCKHCDAEMVRDEITIGMEETGEC